MNSKTMIGGMDFYTYIWIWTDNEKGVYKIKQKRQNSENHKFIYGRNTGKEVKERNIRYKNKEFVYIFHNEALFFPYSSHLTS